MILKFILHHFIPKYSFILYFYLNATHFIYEYLFTIYIYIYMYVGLPYRWFNWILWILPNLSNFLHSGYYIYLLLGLLAVSLKNVKIWCWCLTCIFIEFLSYPISWASRILNKKIRPFKKFLRLCCMARYLFHWIGFAIYYSAFFSFSNGQFVSS